MTWQQLHDESDEELFRQYMAGNRDAIAVLHERHNSRLVKALEWKFYKTGRDRSNADEVAVMTWATVANERSFAPQCFSSWLLFMGNQEFCHAIRRRNKYRREKQTSEDDDDAGIQPTSGATSYIDRRIETEQLTELANLIDALPDNLKETIRLVYFAGLEQAEVARRMGVCPNMVNMRIAKAIERLGRSLYWQSVGRPDQLPEFPNGAAIANVQIMASVAASAKVHHANRLRQRDVSCLDDSTLQCNICKAIWGVDFGQPLKIRYWLCPNACNSSGSRFAGKQRSGQRGMWGKPT